MVPIPPFTPVKRTPADLKLKQGYSIPDYWYETSYNGRKLRYTIEIIGDQSSPDADGYPLYIAMHGGGGSGGDWNNDDGGEDNDNEWKNMYEKFYKLPLASFYPNPPSGQTKTSRGAAVYVTLRGVSTGINTTLKTKSTDDYDLHSRPEGQILVERLIIHLTSAFPSEFNDHPRGVRYKQLLQSAPPRHFINSDKVFLVGFSAGGNGGFELGTRLSDRFAAVVAAAGHPESAYLANLANLPTILQVGEDDAWSYDDNKPVGFHRAWVYLKQANEVLDTHQGDKKYENCPKNRPELYPHTCFVVKNADRNVNRRTGYGVHNYWSLSNLIFDTKQKILNKDYFAKWLETYLAQWQKDTEKKLPALIKDIPDDKYHDDFVTPIPVIAGLKRNLTPPLVVWDLRGRTQMPDKNDPTRFWEQQRYSYWLYLRKPVDPFADKTYEAEWAWYDNAFGTNALHIENPNDYIAYLLQQDTMLNLNAPIQVHIAGSSKSPQSLTVTLSDDIKKTTQEARGDTKWQFSAMIYLEKNGNDWVAKSAKTMAEVGPLNFPAALGFPAEQPQK